MFRGLTITTPAPAVALTTVSRLKSVLGITSTGEDALLADVLSRASAAAESYCNRIFARQVYSEVGPALGGIEFQAKHAPVVALGTVSFDSEVLTDVSIGDRSQGVLYRKDGFDWTAQRWPGLAAGGRLWDIGTPIRGQEEPLWSVAYTAGFILPGLDVASGAVKVMSTDNSFNSTGTLFSAVASWLKDGDVVRVSGFSKNDGRYTVSGTPTSSKIVVNQTLSTGDSATSTGTRTLYVQSLPEDVEQAALETAKTYYQQRKTDSAVVEKQLGLARLRFSEQGGVEGVIGIPPRAAGLLARWVRRT